MLGERWEHERQLGDLLEGYHTLTFCQRLAPNQIKTLPEKGMTREIRHKVILEDKGHVECLRLDPVLKDIAVSVRKLQCHLWQRFPARRDSEAGDTAREGNRNSEIDDTLHLAATRPHNAGKLFELTKNFGGLSVHDCAGRRGANAARTSLEQGEAKPFFKLPHLLTKCGLRHVDRCSSPRKAARFDDLHEIAQMTKLHGRVSSHCFLSERCNRRSVPASISDLLSKLQFCTKRAASHLQNCGVLAEDGRVGGLAMLIVEDRRRWSTTVSVWLKNAPAGGTRYSVARRTAARRHMHLPRIDYSYDARKGTILHARKEPGIGCRIDKKVLKKGAGGVVADLEGKRGGLV
jgi:hypothetical protein